ncbi:hypothetical protein JZ751_000765 [Albula glossodonta]|uniref:Ig-like domain-containing protein n=1 Tax=Albula glossodonta TaxID=121402 RepID=A0A8T2PX99_9TELE|nr:hypothetical protein JZ751_000765 [Albula glossodonta]
MLNRNVDCSPGDLGLSINSDRNVFTGQEGGSVSISCRFTETYLTHSKYWCRGKASDTCWRLKTESTRSLNERVSIVENTTLQIFTMTIRQLERADSGWYWCAVDVPKKDLNIPFYLIVNPANYDVDDD